MERGRFAQPVVTFPPTRVCGVPIELRTPGGLGCTVEIATGTRDRRRVWQRSRGPESGTLWRALAGGGHHSLERLFSRLRK